MKRSRFKVMHTFLQFCLLLLSVSQIIDKPIYSPIQLSNVVYIIVFLLLLLNICAFQFALYKTKTISLQERTHIKGQGGPKFCSTTWPANFPFSFWGALEIAQLNLLFEFVSFAEN